MRKVLASSQLLHINLARFQLVHARRVLTSKHTAIQICFPWSSDCDSRTQSVPPQTKTLWMLLCNNLTKPHLKISHKSLQKTSLSLHSAHATQDLWHTTIISAQVADMKSRTAKAELLTVKLPPNLPKSFLLAVHGAMLPVTCDCIPSTLLYTVTTCQYSARLTKYAWHVSNFSCAGGRMECGKIEFQLF